MATKKKSVAVKVNKAAPKVQKLDFKVSLEDLLEAGSHFGHQVRRWNPKMDEFIWTDRDGVHVFDLAKTAKKLEEACEFLYNAAKENKRIVMVGTKRQAQTIVKEEAVKAGVPYLVERWLGGIITNWGQIKNRINRLATLKDKKEKGELSKYTKKEQLLFDREIARLERFFGGISSLDERPEIIVVVDTHKEKVAVREAVSKGLVVVGITDSNANPDLVDYPIPANDDAIKSIELIVKAVANAISEGKKHVGKD